MQAIGELARTVTTPTSKDVADMNAPIVVVPVGSWEQHGPHLPLDTDTRIACELADRLARRSVDVVRGPSIAVSSSGEHSGFAGTLSVGGRVVVDTAVELVRSADWARGVVLVNGHGGNAAYLERARLLLASEGRPVLIWSPPLVDPCDSHAGYVETSLMMAIDPTSVRDGEISSGPEIPLDEVIGDLRDGGVISVSSSGVLGNPQRADAAFGEQLLEAWSLDLAESVEAWRRGLAGART